MVYIQMDRTGTLSAVASPTPVSFALKSEGIYLCTHNSQAYLLGTDAGLCVNMSLQRFLTGSLLQWDFMSPVERCTTLPLPAYWAIWLGVCTVCH